MQNFLSLIKVTADRYGTLLVFLINNEIPNDLWLSIAKKFEVNNLDIETLFKFSHKEVEAKETLICCRSVIW